MSVNVLRCWMFARSSWMIKWRKINADNRNQLRVEKNYSENERKFRG